MRFLFFTWLFLPAYAMGCDWSDSQAIANLPSLQFQECALGNRLKIDGIKLSATIDINVIGEHYPEANTLWGVLSPNGNLVAVWVENGNYDRNLWLLDRVEKKVLFFYPSIKEARHFQARFEGNNTLEIELAGMGYHQSKRISFEGNHWNLSQVVKNK